jgi:hypothetical protein
MSIGDILPDRATNQKVARSSRAGRINQLNQLANWELNFTRNSAYVSLVFQSSSSEFRGKFGGQILTVVLALLLGYIVVSRSRA